ncbi:hypothetical protein RHSIM_Rhsim12G0008000 [Rhododendron simsii]|uniref:Conserved oligomeric Golgi complex subunit 5 n=1 Tax=Rhododendron simsii TaxID=118357 RepID=A0A834GA01_RHOSS|nr:hypothetical protein RHSIM_Rhsim12G0008000 [Rhododendron simsii]
MASPVIQRSPTPSSPLHHLSSFKHHPTTTTPPSSTTNPFSQQQQQQQQSPLDSFSIDPLFSPFLSPTFSPAQFSSLALSSNSSASTAEKLHHSLTLLDSHLRHLILLNHPSLLSTLSSLRHADSSLSSLRSALSSLTSSLARLRSDISLPHRQIQLKTLTLDNLHRTAALLGSTTRLLRLSGKLREVMDADKTLDLAKAAQLHYEISTLCSENELSGITVVDEELLWVNECGQKLRDEGIRVLERGLEGLNQAEVGAGLQVFYNLGELRVAVDGMVNKYKSQGVKAVSAALDMKAVSASSGGAFGPGGIQRSGTPQIGGGGKAKEALWQRMGSCMDQLHLIVVAVWHLQKVLSKKRDPFTHVLLLDEVMKEGDPMLTDRVWEALVKSFASQMKSAFTSSSFVREIFTGGYPKLYSMIENLLERISRDTDVKGVIPAISSEGKNQMVAAIEMFQTAFLTLCWSRLSELVDTVFPVGGRSIPSKEHFSRIISRIQEEIEAVQPNGRLTLLVLREISKGLRLLAQRAEFQISTGPEARQITGPATPSQLKNFALCQHLQEVHTRISSMMTGLPTIASDVLSPSLNNIYTVACDSVTSLFQAMVERLESCILQIHLHNFGAHGMDATMDNNNASPYMEELQKTLGNFQEFLPCLRHTRAAGTPHRCCRHRRHFLSVLILLLIRTYNQFRPLRKITTLVMTKYSHLLAVYKLKNLFDVGFNGKSLWQLSALMLLALLWQSVIQVKRLLDELGESCFMHKLGMYMNDNTIGPSRIKILTPPPQSLRLNSRKKSYGWSWIYLSCDDIMAKVKSRLDLGILVVYRTLILLLSILF